MENENLYPITTKELADRKAALAPKNLDLEIMNKMIEDSKILKY